MLINFDPRQGYESLPNDPTMADYAFGGTEGFFVSKPGDRVQLNEVVRPVYPYAADFLNKHGISTATEIIWTQDPIDLLDGEKYLPCMYNELYLPGNFSDPRWGSVIQNLSKKQQLQGLLEAIGMPGLAPRSLVLEDSSTFSAEEFEKVFGVNAQVMTKYLFERWAYENVQGPFRGAAEVQAQLHRQYQGCGVQLQQYLANGIDVSMQYLANDEQLIFLGTTRQIVINNHHQGNVSPIDGEYGGSTMKIANYLYGLGIKGFFGVDMRITTENGAEDAYTIELNLRRNGASPSMYRKRALGMPAMVYKGVRCDNVPSQVFQKIEASGLGFNGTRGILPVQWGKVPSGKINVVAYGESVAECQTLQDDLARVLA